MSKKKTDSPYQKMNKANKSRMTTLLATPYRECPIVIEKYDKDLFVWHLVHKDSFYGDYMVIAPEKGKKKLTKEQDNHVAMLCFAAATATIDELDGVELTKEQVTTVKKFEELRTVAE